ncbi:MAG TPA: hypothetical protein VJ438_05390 [Candidatus Nanoarchaeia archaeon]|nr:hypothetical protein [Candidatus Nanoarchaeia archaeon]
MISIKCKCCSRVYELDEKNIDISLEYIECCFCGNTFKNPFYEFNGKQ